MTASFGILSLLIWSLHVSYVFSSCAPGTKTVDPQGRCCVFPFVYGGVSYDACTTYGNGNTPWCSFTATYIGQWANCANPCNSNPCQNGGTCTKTGDETYTCQCTDQYEGDNCETQISCPPGKRTVDPQGRCCVFPFVYAGVSYDACTTYGNGNTPWCSFTATYIGQWANCANPCTSEPCENGGTCTVTGEETHSCQCTDQYKGDNCETQITCPPGKKTVDPQGRCCVFPFVYGGVSYDACTTYGNGNTPWCSLTATYIGQWANCVDECAGSPCKNGATCSPTEEGYSCQPCSSGWQGKDCDEDIDECAGTNPCANGGTCDNTPGGYSCQCMSGYTGIHCEQDINECDNNPCINGGTCQNQPGGYTCDCASGFEGANCQTDINECEPQNPCLNGGTCKNSPGTYTCDCAAGYTGDHCQDVDWTSEGCYKENNKPGKRALNVKFATVKDVDMANPDVEHIFNKCRGKAEANGYEIFGVRNTNRCVTSSDGKMADFKKLGMSTECTTDGQGHGVGTGESGTSNYVYTR